MALDVTVIVPSINRPTLFATLASIPKAWKIDLRVDANPNGNLGHPARNAAMKDATSDWLMFLDDDDIYVPDVQAIVEANVTERRPHVFQMRYGPAAGRAPGTVLWDKPELANGNVGTPMFVVPNEPGRLGVWPERQAGDFFFIRETCALQGGPVFVPEVIALIRP